MAKVITFSRVLELSKITKYVSRSIYKELSFTNGWHISDDRYKELCDKIAAKITKRLNLKSMKQYGKRK